ncbi:MAG: YggS family pyridoxal phosphate-dependent enzyme [Dysgonamonadaceae bacterium]|jgi:pyridoxal phosphate enzyme (YggS family)|nr:YggS family pyridoxal phosphate-dependent enzyme [Dysgonamonadaceae bacterium]
MSISARLNRLKNELPENIRLVAVSKFHPETAIQEAYDSGQRIFGESRVQELLPKYEHLPKDVEWHFIGHLQLNKVKQIAPFIDTIHSIDSVKLLSEVNKEAAKFNRQINVLLQIHIAQEEHKFGFSFDEVEELLKTGVFATFPYLHLSGLMGMATFTDEKEQIRQEFHGLNVFFQQMKAAYFPSGASFHELSMGMTDDYPIALEEGATIVRIGSKIFGPRGKWTEEKSVE